MYFKPNVHGGYAIYSGQIRYPMKICTEGQIQAPNDTAYKRWSCHSGLKLLCKLCRTSPPPTMGARFTVFWACRPCGPAGCLAVLLTKAGDVETNPGPTTLNKKVWICDICHKQIHVRKQISIRCNRIEYWVHPRCAGIRQAQYRYLDLPSTQIIQTHTSHRHNTTPPLPTLVQAPYPLNLSRTMDQHMIYCYCGTHQGTEGMVYY